MMREALMRRMIVILVVASLSAACSSLLDFKPKTRDVVTDATDAVQDPVADEARQDPVEDTPDAADVDGVEAPDADATEMPDAAGPKGTVVFMSAAGGVTQNEQYRLQGSVRASDCGPATGGGYTLKSCSVEILNH